MSSSAEYRDGSDRPTYDRAAAIKEQDAEEQPGSRRLDPELRTMGAMLRMLDDLDDKARARVVTYLSSRYP